MSYTTFVIPYVHKKAASDELKIAIRSIITNYKGSAEIFIVGDLPEWANPLLAANHLPVKLIEGMNYAHCFDVNNKVRKFLAQPSSPKEFIYSYDDVVFLNPVKKADITRLKADSFIESEEFILKNSTGSRKWNNLLITSLKYLQAHSLPTFNYETHLPRLFKSSDLQSIFDIPDFSIEPFLFSTIYFNVFGVGKPAIVGSEKCDIKTTIYSDEFNSRQIAQMCEGKLFLNFNSKGYSKAMQRFLHNRFPNKSRYEL